MRTQCVCVWVCVECQCAVTDMTVCLHPPLWEVLLTSCAYGPENDYSNVTPHVHFTGNIGKRPTLAEFTRDALRTSPLLHFDAPQIPAKL